MLSKSGFVAVSAMILIAFPNAVAQYGGAGMAALNGSDAGTVKGQPFALVEQVTDTTPTAAGVTVPKYSTELKWRDSQGRFRREASRMAETNEPVYHTATIVDPVKNTLAVLDLDHKTARLIHLQPGQLQPFSLSDEDTPPALPGVKVMVEKLDGKQVNGFYAVGRRVTRTRPPGTVGNDKTLVSVSERWLSPEIKVLIAASEDDPREQRHSDVTELSRSEPDASLFQIPADYTVTEVAGRPML